MLTVSCYVVRWYLANDVIDLMDTNGQSNYM